MCECNSMPATGVRLVKGSPSHSASYWNDCGSLSTNCWWDLCVCKWNWCQLLESGWGHRHLWTVVQASAATEGPIINSRRGHSSLDLKGSYRCLAHSASYWGAAVRELAASYWRQNGCVGPPGLW